MRRFGAVVVAVVVAILGTAMTALPAQAVEEEPPSVTVGLNSVNGVGCDGGPGTPGAGTATITYTGDALVVTINVTDGAWPHTTLTIEPWEEAPGCVSDNFFKLPGVALVTDASGVGSTTFTLPLPYTHQFPDGHTEVLGDEQGTENLVVLLDRTQSTGGGDSYSTGIVSISDLINGIDLHGRATVTYTGNNGPGSYVFDATKSTGATSAQWYVYDVTNGDRQQIDIANGMTVDYEFPHGGTYVIDYSVCRYDASASPPIKCTATQSTNPVKVLFADFKVGDETSGADYVFDASASTGPIDYYQWIIRQGRNEIYQDNVRDSNKLNIRLENTGTYRVTLIVGNDDDSIPTTSKTLFVDVKARTVIVDTSATKGLLTGEVASPTQSCPTGNLRVTSEAPVWLYVTVSENTAGAVASDYVTQSGLLAPQEKGHHVWSGGCMDTDDKMLRLHADAFADEATAAQSLDLLIGLFSPYDLSAMVNDYGVGVEGINRLRSTVASLPNLNNAFNCFNKMSKGKLDVLNAGICAQQAIAKVVQRPEKGSSELEQLAAVVADIVGDVSIVQDIRQLSEALASLDPMALFQQALSGEPADRFGDAVAKNNGFVANAQVQRDGQQAVVEASERAVVNATANKTAAEGALADAAAELARIKADIDTAQALQDQLQADIRACKKTCTEAEKAALRLRLNAVAAQLTDLHAARKAQSAKIPLAKQAVGDAEHALDQATRNLTKANKELVTLEKSLGNLLKFGEIIGGFADVFQVWDTVANEIVLFNKGTTTGDLIFQSCDANSTTPACVRYNQAA